ncbi:subtilisin-like protease SBT3.17 isoform X1 [Cucumis melo var. makuwa]|uniref:Subtilisin-like protease SBT3.17 isoform X1 n=1 Tax=Cucumis melo var. makuwa TaxID=1194695 RepID=A0A5D3BBJ3_CUCMM|nr:subtilisin-like protease SBT3.17 isoform X1 [Cucumis melo var. makuwa]TYJ96314.1 subtilisin-like protease SBT3.17 isoform X1 [Cucumis melo var. makuwa]
MRARSETFVNVGSNVPNNLDVVPLGRSSEGRNGSSGSKRKRGREYYKMVDVIRNAIFANDQLKAIVDRHKDQKHAMEVELHEKVVK